MHNSNNNHVVAGIYVVILTLILSSMTWANVIFVSGDVSGTWSADSVIVSDSIYVSPGNTLVIEPGVQVLFLTAFYFRVKSGAVLHAVGTETEHISFLPMVQGYSTLGINFENASDESILEYCYFNHALYSAITLRNSSITIRNCILEGNPGYATGGGIAALEGSDALIENNTIRDNEGGSEGGAIYCDASSPIIRGNIIDGNSTYGLGGAIACENYSQPMIIGNTISNNQVTPSTFPPGPGEGGGIYCSDESSPIIDGNLFYNNRVNPGGDYSYNGGGAIFVFSADPVIMNNVFNGNTASGDDGGAIFLFNSNSHMVNNTFINNSAGHRGGAVYIVLSSYPEITNSILRGNSAPNGPAIYLSNSDITVAYSNIEGGWEGDGNIDMDPLFRDPTSGDYHLMAIECDDPYDSPCIDAGDPALIDSLLDCDWGLGTIISDMGTYGGGDSALVDINFPQATIPERFNVIQNYPNPFNASTVIKYELPKQLTVSIDILDALGRKVANIQNGSQPAGYHQIIWNASDASSGIYFYRIQAGDHAETVKMLLLK